jgi:hypothetical protein
MHYRIVLRDGADTLHVEHPFEECNVDDAADAQTVDELTAMALVARGDAQVCQHCQPLEQSS